MTLDERKAGVEAALKQIEQAFGLRLFAALETEPLNAGIVQVRAVLKAEPIPDWQPLQADEPSLKPGR